MTDATQIDRLIDRLRASPENILALLDALTAERERADKAERERDELQRNVDEAGKIILAHGVTQRDLTRKLAEAEQVAKYEIDVAEAEICGRKEAERKLAEAVELIKVSEAYMPAPSTTARRLRAFLQQHSQEHQTT